MNFNSAKYMGIAIHPHLCYNRNRAYALRSLTTVQDMHKVRRREVILWRIEDLCCQSD